jgi:hypothetical protein
MSNIRSISGEGRVPGYKGDPLGLTRKDYAHHPRTPEYEARMSALKVIEDLRATTNSALVNNWAKEEETRVNDGGDLELDHLYYTLQSEDPELSDTLEKKVKAYRQIVSALTTSVRSTVVKVKEETYGFDDEEDVQSA